MSKDTPTITAELRERFGTRYAKRLRRSGRLPAVVYGHQKATVAVSLDEKEILGHLHGGAHVINVDTGTGSTETCLVKELQFGFLGDNLIHVDFARVDLDEEVTVTIQIAVSGQPVMAKETGAVLEVIRPEIEVRCKVRDIPSGLEADLSSVEEVFTVGDLEIPAGVEALIDPEKHIAHITFAKEVEEEDVEDQLLEGEEGQPEVIGDDGEDDAEAAADEVPPAAEPEGSEES